MAAVGGYSPEAPDDAFIVRLTLGKMGCVVAVAEEVDLFVLDASMTLEVTCSLAGSARAPGGRELGAARAGRRRLTPG